MGMAQDPNTQVFVFPSWMNSELISCKFNVIILGVNNFNISGFIEGSARQQHTSFDSEQ